MPDPPRDEDGWVEPYDDPDIIDTDCVIRYIHPIYHVTFDSNLGRQRLSSGAFSPSKDGSRGMSVDLQRNMRDAGLDGLSRLPSEEHGAVQLTVADLRQLDLLIGSTPRADNEFHADVWHTHKESTRKKIRKLARWLRKPDGYDGD